MKPLLLAVACFVAAVNCTPPKRNNGFVPHPKTPAGAKFKQCTDTFVQETGISFPDPYDPGKALDPSMDADFAEAVVAQWKGDELDAYCNAVGSANFRKAVREHRAGRSHASKGSTNPNQNKGNSGSRRLLHFEDPAFETISTKGGLFKPHDAEYGASGDLMSFLLQTGNVIVDAETRTDADTMSFFIDACMVVKTVRLTIEFVCGAGGTAGVWAGGGFIAEGGVWDAPVGTACYLAAVVAGIADEVCENVLDAASAHDSSVDSAEIQGAYENGKKAITNQEIIWDKVETARAGLAASIASAEANILAQVLATQAAIQADLANTLNVLVSKNCELQNNLAHVQDEVNWLRRLLLTPEGQRPGFNCPKQMATWPGQVGLPQCKPNCGTTLPHFCSAVSLNPSPPTPGSICDASTP